MEVLMLK